MGLTYGITMAIACLAATLFIAAAAGVGLVILQISEERHGHGCRGEGCRRRPEGRESNHAPRGAESARGDITPRERWD